MGKICIISKNERDPLIGSVKVKEIDSNCLFFQGFNPYDKIFSVNSVVIKSNDVLLFIDSGFNPKCSEFMWNQSIKHWPSFDIIDKFFVLTHHHLDHSFGMNFFIERNIPVIAHIKSIEYLEGNTENYVNSAYNVRYPVDLEKTIYAGVKLSKPDILINNNFVLSNSEIEIIPTPGHSPDSLVVYQKDRKILISGDSILQQPPNPTIPMEKVPRHIYEISQKKIKELSANLILPGHGNMLKID